MGAKAWLGVMAFGTVLVLVGFRRSETPSEDPAPKPIEQPQWLSREAAAQLIGPDGVPGPLFADVVLGTPVSRDTRDRLAAFAREHDVEIELETVEDDVIAIRLAVTFRGGFGYEGSDVFALKLRRPTTGCCGCTGTWLDDWAREYEHGVFMRASVRANRVAVRWERTMSLDEVIARARELVGASAATVRDAAGDRWIDRGERLYSLQVPYGFNWYPEANNKRSLDLRVERGTIVAVTFEVRELDDRDYRRLRRDRTLSIDRDLGLLTFTY